MYNPEEGLYRDPRGNETKVFDMSAYDKYRLTDSHGFPETGQSFRGPGGGGEASGDPAVGAPPGYRRDPISGYYYPDWAFAQAEGLGQQQGGNVGAQEPALLDPEQYGPTVMDLMMQDALNKHWGLSGRYDELLGAAPDLSGGQRNALSQAETAGDWYFDQGQDSYGLAKDYFAQAGAAGDQWYGAGWDSYGKADGLIDQQVAALNYAKEGNQWYDDYTRNQLTQAADMTGSGVIPKAMEDAMMGSMNRMLESSMGQMMNDMAGRGVINSSVNTTGMANLGKQAANAYQDNYLQTFDTLLKGIQGNAAQGISGGDTFGRTNLGIAAGYGDASGNARQLGDSYVGAGSQRTTDLLNVGNAYNNNANSLMQAGSGRINDWLNIGQGYDQALNTNIRERESVMNQMPQNWQNALGPAGIVPGLLEQLLSDWANTGGRTTVVS
jgi:hypothetical protein